MNKNVKIAKQLIKIAKSLVSSDSLLQEVFDLNELKRVGQYYNYGNGHVVLMTVIEDEWLPVLANGSYEAKPDIEEEVKQWEKEVKYIDFGDCEQEPSVYPNGCITKIIIKENSPLLKGNYYG